METLRIYKFSLADLDAACFDDTVVVEAPFIRGVDHVGVQDGTLMLWSMVGDSAPCSRRQFYISGTGQSVPRNTHYLGTAQHRAYVWHVFELISMAPAR
jgi:hypothetical protein